VYYSNNCKFPTLSNQEAVAITLENISQSSKLSSTVVYPANLILRAISVMLWDTLWDFASQNPVWRNHPGDNTGMSITETRN
jgi:hypothetical protein